MNPYNQSLNTYKNQQVQTASREQLLILLYDGAIRFLNLAKQGKEQANVEQYHTNITKAQRILTEFMATLDVDLGGEVAQNLYRLYEYLHYQLLQASLKKDVTMVDEVLGHLRQLKTTWEEAILLAQKDQVYTDHRDSHAYSA